MLGFYFIKIERQIINSYATLSGWLQVRIVSFLFSQIIIFNKNDRMSLFSLITSFIEWNDEMFVTDGKISSRIMLDNYNKNPKTKIIG